MGLFPVEKKWWRAFKAFLFRDGWLFLSAAPSVWLSHCYCVTDISLRSPLVPKTSLAKCEEEGGRHKVYSQTSSLKSQAPCVADSKVVGVRMRRHVKKDTICHTWLKLCALMALVLHLERSFQPYENGKLMRVA